MPNPENLKPFTKGHSGNPAGRPLKEYCLTDLLRQQGDIQDFETKEGLITRNEGIAQKLWDMAISGDVSSIKYLFDRIDGKPLQQVETNTVNSEPDETFEIVKAKLSKIEMKELARISRKIKS